MLMVHTALHAEGLALINHYKLRRQHHIKPFACYARDDIFLIESGIGKIHTAAAIAWANATIDADSPVWVNLGMAGHGKHAVGSCLLASCIEDEHSGQQTCLTPLTISAAGRENLLTLDEPADSYPTANMVDMEGSAFARIAHRFTSLELIQSIKVISDNTQNPAQRLKTSEVETLFRPHLDTIEQAFQQLRNTRQAHQPG